MSFIQVTTYRQRAAGSWRWTERRCTSWREVFALVAYTRGVGRVQISAAGDLVFVEIGL